MQRWLRIQLWATYELQNAIARASDYLLLRLEADRVYLIRKIAVLDQQERT
jgi:hypothetical protein